MRSHSGIERLETLGAFVVRAEKIPSRQRCGPLRRAERRRSQPHFSCRAIWIARPG
jgi:hypothetical protein